MKEKQKAEGSEEKSEKGSEMESDEDVSTWNLMTF
tara:strand:+ start:70 stop:174 length:105 start_codon:yes stop_codon:yes gene_type:complete